MKNPLILLAIPVLVAFGLWAGRVYHAPVVHGLSRLMVHRIIKASVIVSVMGAFSILLFDASLKEGLILGVLAALLCWFFIGPRTIKIGEEES